MNAPEYPKIDDATLDMLVDGELSEEERRKLLLSLEKTRDGWRRCALAFLEARSWKESLAEIPRQAPRPEVRKESGRRAVPRFGTPLAMAASFLLALLLGLGIDNMLESPAPHSPPNQVASTGAARAPLQAGPAAIASGEAAPRNIAPYQYVTLPVPEAAASDSPLIELPVSPRSEIDKGWLSSVPFAVPESVVQSLQQRGHEVRQQRHVIPYVTEDGKPVVFPVDEVQLQYVGNRDYQ